jgi:uncharacterized protein DUF4013
MYTQKGSTRMDIGKSFGYVFEDQEWITKVLLGGLILLIPIVGQLVVIGYMLKVAQNVAQGNPRPLPSWNEFGDHLTRGLYGFVVELVYFVPYIVIVVLFSCVGGLLGAGSRSNSASAVGALFGCLLVPVYLIAVCACLCMAYAGLARLVATNNLSEALKFGDVFATVRSNPRPWLMMLLVSLLAGLVGSLGLIACGIGVLFTAAYAYLIMGHALGQTVAQQGALAGTYVPTPPPSYGPPPSYQ